MMFYMGSQLPLKGGTAPQFSARVYCGQTVGWIEMPLGTEEVLGPGHIVLDGVSAPSRKEHSPLFLAHVYCGHSRPSQLLLSSCFSMEPRLKLNKTRHRASTSMYSLTFCVRVMSPERHHWKPAVQAAAIMLRTPPPRRRPVTGRPATPICHIRRAILGTPPSPAGH